MDFTPFRKGSTAVRPRMGYDETPVSGPQGLEAILRGFPH